jgi:Spy/CpxP family protein refolding chaperone
LGRKTLININIQNMKNLLKIMGILLVLSVTGSGTLYAQRGMRGMNRSSDTVRMRFMNRNADSVMFRSMNRGMRPGMRGNGPMGIWRDSAFVHRSGMYGMYGGIRHMPMNRMRPGYFPMRPGRGYYRNFGMQRGMRQGNIYRPGPWQQRPAFGRLDNIPNLTDKQKKEISDLRQKQQDEMKKFRDETSTRMQDMRKEHREKIMNILTDEQKKYLEENSGNLRPPAR